MDPLLYGIGGAVILTNIYASFYASWAASFGVLAASVAICWTVLNMKVPLIAELTKNWRDSVPFVGKDKVVLLTGATCASGIGAQLALMYHERFSDESTESIKINHCPKLILVGRKSLDSLLAECKASSASGGDTFDCMEKMLRAASTLYLQVDLMGQDCGAKLASGLKENKVLKVDLVVQLHGNGWIGPFMKQTEKSVQDTINVNFRGTVLVTKHLLPFLDMKRKDNAAPSTHSQNWEVDPKEKTSKIVIISSIVSQRATPAFAVYTAAKNAVDHFAWSLLTELCDSNVGVQLLHVCATDTAFFSKCGLPAGAMNTSKFASPTKMAADLCDAIDYSRNFRSTFGTFTEQAQFFLSWQLPEQWWRRYKLKGAAAIFSPAGPYNPGTGGYLSPRGGSKGPLRCIVTGGSQGIGEAICHEIVDKESGSSKSKSVEVLSLDVQPPKNKKEGVTHSKIDLSSDDITSSFNKSVEDTFGKDNPIDVLINNAGVNFSGRLDDASVSDGQIALMIAVNVTAPIVLTIAAINWNAEVELLPPRSVPGKGPESASKKKPPALVFVSSCSHYFSYPGSCAYGATKDAVASYAKSVGFALAGASSVLTVYPTVYPGPTDTPQAAATSPHQGEKEEQAKQKRCVSAASCARVCEWYTEGTLRRVSLKAS
jgi:NAD(P)-dependent dehydrogenase (short-subunit alcohol dehydrogenase family)